MARQHADHFVHYDETMTATYSHTTTWQFMLYFPKVPVAVLHPMWVVDTHTTCAKWLKSRREGGGG